MKTLRPFRNKDLPLAEADDWRCDIDWYTPAWRVPAIVCSDRYCKSTDAKLSVIWVFKRYPGHPPNPSQWDIRVHFKHLSGISKGKYANALLHPSWTSVE